MDFFKSVFADEPSPGNSSEYDDHHRGEDRDDAGLVPAEDPGSNSNSSAWSFGGLIKTLATKSETVIQTYRRDLEEFGSGLKKETAVIRDVASRAVKDLPGSLEAGASVAQGSLESVGQAIDDIGSSVWKSTAEIITHGKDSLLAADEDSDENNSNSDGNSKQLIGGQSSDSKPYNRFEAQLRAIQSSASTYLDDPEDLGNYEQWTLGFALDEKSEEIEGLVKENGEIAEIYENFVPEKIDRESFWLRYFYKVQKLKEVEDARVKLVKRAISGEEEDLSWDFDDEDEDEDEGEGEGEGEGKSEGEIKELNEKSSEIVDEHESVSVSDNGDKAEAPKLEEKVAPQGKASESSDSAKESDVSIVSRPEEEDLEWDEIEDLGSGDEAKAADSVGSSSKADPRKRLSNAAEEEEDLTWDIEDDDDDDDDDEKRKS